MATGEKKVAEKDLHDVTSFALQPHRADTYMKDAARRGGRPELADAPGENDLDNVGDSSITGSAAVLDHPEFSPHPDVRADVLSKDDQDKAVEKADEKAAKADEDAAA